MLTPAFGFSFPDLYDRDALARLDAAFLDFVDRRDARSARPARRRAPQPAALGGEGRVRAADRARAACSRTSWRAVRHRARRSARSRRATTSSRRSTRSSASSSSARRCTRTRRRRRPRSTVRRSSASSSALLGEPFSELAFARRVTEWQQDEAAQRARRSSWRCATPRGRRTRRRARQRQRRRAVQARRASSIPAARSASTTDASGGYSAHDSPTSTCAGARDSR